MLADGEQQRIKAAVIGASGFAGAELLRLLLAHPQVEVVLAAASSGRGEPLALALPALRGLTKLPLAAVPTAGSWPDLDCVFLCLPHGASRELVPQLPETVRIIDLSGDFRLHDPEQFAAFYGIEPPPAQMQASFVYGLAECSDRSRIATATRIANPGCFATASILALAPLVKDGLIEDRVIIDAKTGSTGAGTKPLAATVHASRSSSLYGYKSYTHQHLPEIRQALAALAPGWGEALVFQAHATPLVRGILATVYARLRPQVTAQQVAASFQQAYGEQPFMRLGEAPANPAWSRGSNFVDLSWAAQGAELVVFSALDNLGKGAAGQAVQNMNLMFSLPEISGLWQGGSVP